MKKNAVEVVAHAKEKRILKMLWLTPEKRRRILSKEGGGEFLAGAKESA